MGFIWDRPQLYNGEIDNFFPKKRKYWCLDFTDCTSRDAYIAFCKKCVDYFGFEDPLNPLMHTSSLGGNCRVLFAALYYVWSFALDTIGYFDRRYHLSHMIRHWTIFNSEVQWGQPIEYNTFFRAAVTNKIEDIFAGSCGKRKSNWTLDCRLILRVGLTDTQF